MLSIRGAIRLGYYMRPMHKLEAAQSEYSSESTRAGCRAG